MKKRSVFLTCTCVILLSVLLFFVAFKLSGAFFNDAVPHRQVMQDVFRHQHRGLAPMMNGFHEGRGMNPVSSTNPIYSVWLVLLQIAVLVGGAVLFVKAKGGLKWIGALFAALSLMSLLTPVWGMVIIIAVFLLYRRITNHRKNLSPQALSSGTPTFIEMSKSRGQVLDEWERNQHKEEY